uniref:Uncharacterized protein n=1 Tax=Sphaerodactylus townsendi TaxID=933632 RepID=A0ACB8EFP2_9SAUR
MEPAEAGAGEAAPGPAGVHEGWFRETCSLWPGQALSLQVDQILHHRRSPFQEILVFRSKTYGNVLVLDGVIQCTERDEFSYQEMIANLPLCSHRNPRKVLIIGGGDGGVLREVVKHPSVESVIQCEIDEDVIEASKKYLPGMAVGPAESLFKESYYQLMKTALKEDGILCCQGECQWLHLDLIKEMRQFCKSLFPSTNFREPVQQLSQEQVDAMGLKYYNSDIHRAAFVLPEFARKPDTVQPGELLLQNAHGHTTLNTPNLV